MTAGRKTGRTRLFPERMTPEMEIILTDVQLVGITLITLSIGILIGYYSRKKENNPS